MPNTALQLLLVQAGWNQSQLAAAIRAVAVENRHVVACDRSTVSRWLAGTHPRPPASTDLLEALSRRLSRPVAAREAGLTRTPVVVVNTSWDVDPIRKIASLAHGQLEGGGRTPLSAGAYNRSALTVPLPAELVAGTSRHQAPLPSVRRVGRVEVETLRAMTDFVAGLAAAHGGQPPLTVLTAYLARDVTAYLYAPATESVHCQILSAAAQLSILLGNICIDGQEESLAQQYHRTAAHLAADADDLTTYAIALRAMATHAHDLGHHRPALALARQAAGIAHAHAPGITRAYVQAQLAIGEAYAGNRSEALTALQAAERFHAEADQAPGPFTSYPAAGLHYQRSRALSALGDHAGASAALAASLRTRGDAARRNRALTRARLAETLLQQGLREAALHHWHAFLDDYLALRSVSAARHLATMRQLLQPHRTHPQAARLLMRAAPLS